MLQEDIDSTIVQMDLSKNRFAVDVEISILRVEDRETNKEVFMPYIYRHVDRRDNAARRVN